MTRDWETMMRQAYAPGREPGGSRRWLEWGPALAERSAKAARERAELDAAAERRRQLGWSLYRRVHPEVVIHLRNYKRENDLAEKVAAS